MTRQNAFDADCSAGFDDSDPEGYRCAEGPFGRVDGEQAARVVMFSSAAEPAIAVYPDGDKVGVWSGDEHDHWMFRGADAHLDYYDGELPPKH